LAYKIALRFLERAAKIQFWIILKFGRFGMKLDHFGACQPPPSQITTFCGHFPRLSTQAIFATKVGSW
jgi:hypothetical protein